MRRLKVLLVSLVLVFAAFLFVNTDGSVACATETTETLYEDGKKDFIAEKTEITNVIPSAETAGYEEWLFAGWYTEQKCASENAIKEISDKIGENAWAKFVPSDLLKVKVQFKNGTKGSEKTNMRLVSSVDTADYSKIGFYIEYVENEKVVATKTFRSSTVYNKIIASAESGVDYKYNAKVIDSKSLAFITATITNIPSERYENNFVIKAFWETPDGTRVYGQSRYVQIQDDYNDVVNVPVKVDSEAALQNLKIKDATIRERRYHEGEAYGALMVSVASRSALPSLTKYTVMSGENTVATEYYRNLQSALGTVKNNIPKGDQTWYSAISDEKEFVIVTAADLYGMAELSNSTNNNVGRQVNFDDQTIYLGADITINELGENETAPSLKTKGNSYKWVSVASLWNDTYSFKGTFDGLGKTISGLYVIDDSGNDKKYYGLFGTAYHGSVIRDFRIENSYFESVEGVGSNGGTYAQMGSVVGQLGGELNTVYSNATIVSGNMQVGGLVGRIHTGTTTTNPNSIPSTIVNSWFDGSLMIAQASCKAKIQAGGILGVRTSGVVNISDCLNTGAISYTYETVSGTSYELQIGGIAGNLTSSTARNCVSMGNILYKETEGVTFSGTNLIAYNGTKNNNIASSTEKIDTYNGHLGYKKMSDTVVTSGSKLKFYNPEHEDEATNGKWVCREADNTTPINGIPVLKSFCDAYIDVAWYYNTDDYNAGNHTFNISTEEEFFGFSSISQDYTFENDTVILCEDVVLDKVAGREWTPIGTKESRFRGIFDGGNHTISGVHVKANDSEKYFGLFGYTRNNIIKNFRLEDSTYTGTAFGMGCVVGSGEGDISGIYCDNSVSISNASACFIGGIIGHIQDDSRSGAANRLADTNCTVKNCWFNGSISQIVTGADTSDAAGIIGFGANGTLIIDNCLYSGTITISYTGAATKKDSYAAGLCGHHNGGTNSRLTISNSLSAGIIHGSTYARGYEGAVLGNYGGQETYNKVYATTACCSNAVGKISTTQPITPVDADTLYNTIANLDQTYWLSRATDVPVLKSLNNSSEIAESVVWLYRSVGNERDPYMISNADAFQGFGTLVNAGNTFEGEFVSLANDIVVSEGDAKEWAEGNDLPSVFWTPIGRTNTVFRGTFDGCGNTVSGVCVKSTEQYLGLFGHTFNSTIKNLRIRNSYFAYTGSKDAYMGSLLGYGDGIIQNVYSDAIVYNNPTAANKGQVGGLVGRVQRNTQNNNQNANTLLTMTDCWFDGVISSGVNGTHAGGIAGVLVYGTLELNNALFTGKISSQYSGTDAMYMGGLVGRTLANPTNLLIDSAISAGTIEGNHTYSKVGSIVGNVGNGIMNNNKTNASPINPRLELINVFATRECCGLPYFTDGVKEGTLLVSAAQKDEAGNVIVDAVTQTITSTIQITNQVIWVQNADRLIGYCTENVATEVGYMGGSLDYTSDSPGWIVRGKGTPVPAVFEDLLNPVYGTQKVAVSDLDKAIGLDKWKEFDSNASLANAVHYGNGKYVLTLGSSEQDTKTTYDAYIAHLTKATEEGGLGFTTFASNTLDEVYDTIYTKEDGDWVLNVLHTANTGVTTITIRTGIDEVLSPNLKAENVVQEGEENITLSMLTLTGSEEKEEFIPGVETHLYNYGNSFVFQLPNKHFIISDGGNKNDLAGLITYLQKMVGTEEKIVIDAWIASHQHGDHFGVMMEFVNDPSLSAKISVEAIYINEPNNRALDFIYYDEDDQKYEKINEGVQSQHRGMRLLKTSSNKTTPVYSYQTGERYYFNGMTMDVIQSQEQISVANYAAKKDGKQEGTDFNTVSSVVLFTTKDGEKVLIGGDANYKNMDYIMNAYGEDPDTLDGIDVFVALHHGKNTSHNISTTDTVFTNYLTDNGLNKFEVVLFPCEKLYGIDSLTDFGAFPSAKNANVDLINNHIVSKENYYTFGENLNTVILVEFGDTITHGEVSIPE